MSITPDVWITWIFYIPLTLGGARVVRLITVDSYPPAKWTRRRFSKLVRYGDWQMLVHCFWCAAPWVILLLGGIGYAFGFHGTPHGLSVGAQLTWLFCTWMAISYAASMIVRRDGDETDPEDDE